MHSVIGSQVLGVESFTFYDWQSSCLAPSLRAPFMSTITFVFERASTIKHIIIMCILCTIYGDVQHITPWLNAAQSRFSLISAEKEKEKKVHKTTSFYSSSSIFGHIKRAQNVSFEIPPKNAQCFCCCSIQMRCACVIRKRMLCILLSCYKHHHYVCYVVLLFGGWCCCCWWWYCCARQRHQKYTVYVAHQQPASAAIIRPAKLSIVVIIASAPAAAAT